MLFLQYAGNIYKASKTDTSGRMRDIASVVMMLALGTADIRCYGLKLFSHPYCGDWKCEYVVCCVVAVWHRAVTTPSYAPRILGAMS